MPINVEIKARCANLAHVRDVLTASGARCVGVDRQTDTYFMVPTGRLKLRQGNIETNLIHYLRQDGASPKTSSVRLYDPADPDGLRQILAGALGVKTTVDKRREIYFCGNVKIHVDEVERLGSFIEIEVIADVDPEVSGADESSMRETCTRWMERLGITEHDLLAQSYSDMIQEAD